MKNSFSFPQLFLRLALGTGFIVPVMDRLGLLGPVDSRNIAWGNWDNFLTYTNMLMPYLERSVANVMGIIATLAEVVIGIMLIAGLKTRTAAIGGFLLTMIFALCMTIFLGFKAPVNYSVFPVSAACLLLAAIPVYRWSIDHSLSK